MVVLCTKIKHGKLKSALTVCRQTLFSNVCRTIILQLPTKIIYTVHSQSHIHVYGGRRCWNLCALFQSHIHVYSGRCCWNLCTFNFFPSYFGFKTPMPTIFNYPKESLSCAFWIKVFTVYAVIKIKIIIIIISLKPARHKQVSYHSVTG